MAASDDKTLLSTEMFYHAAADERNFMKNI